MSLIGKLYEIQISVFRNKVLLEHSHPHSLIFVCDCLCAPLGELRGEGNGTPLQHYCLENPMDGAAWWAAVHGVAKSRTWLSDFTFTVHFHALEKEMATHSSVLAWRIPGTGEPGGLPSMGSHRVGHDWSDLAAAAATGELRGCRDHLMWKSWKCISWSSIGNLCPLCPRALLF